MKLRLSVVTATGCLLFVAAGISRGNEFPAPFNHGTGADERPLDPQAAASGFKMPAGFRAQVFSAEPDVQNPLAMTWDVRGRLWVAECYT
jgi:hypothetical protein